MIRDYLPLSYLPFSEAFLPQITQIVSSGGSVYPPEVHFSTPPLPLPSAMGGE